MDPYKANSTRTNGGSMADRWIPEIRYRQAFEKTSGARGHPYSSWTFEDFASLGARVEMDAHRDEIESITITPNRPAQPSQRT